MEKKTSLFNQPKKKVEKDVKDMNIFEKEKFRSEHHTFSGNGAHKLTSTGNPFVDDFCSIGTYRELRDYNAVAETMVKLWSINKKLCVKEMVYIRIISRETKHPLTGELIGKSVGQGLKNEFWHRMYWLFINHPNAFKRNINVFIAAGSWDDIFELMRLDLSYDHTNKPFILDWEFLLDLITTGLNEPNAVNLIKKYLPQIKSKKQCTTLRNQCNNFIAKKIADKLFKENTDVATRYHKYRMLKSSGTAHEFQQLISQQNYDTINFDLVPGRVLGKMVKSRDYITFKGKTIKSDGTSFVERHGLDKKYDEWLDKQPVAKFTGFVYELFNQPMNTKLQRKTIDKQYKGLIEFAKKDVNLDNRFICCIDTSGSMSNSAVGTSVPCITIAKSMAMYFSEFLNGEFANTFLEFAHSTIIRTWDDGDACAKFNSPMSGAMNNTDVLSVARLFVDLRNKGYDERNFPTGAVLVSD